MTRSFFVVQPTGPPANRKGTEIADRRSLGAGLDPRPDEQGLGQTGDLGALGAVLGALVLIIRRRTRRQPPLTPAGAHP